ncbi:hypothetical protein U9M48_006523 [Paspalum notatum var. saurae]|uniref:CASP-like protein n=1 Tax=Paspalum notatum var. saurae TaxID=547442 RepID=A0AAQ3Q017_PASNO
MFASRPVVHPMEVEAAPAPAPAQQPPPPWVLMKDLPGMPGTPGSLSLRVTQLLFAAMSLAIMSSTVDFASITAFCYLVAGAILQCVWSLFVAIVDLYAILVKRCLRNRRAVALFAIGDGVRKTLSMFFVMLIIQYHMGGDLLWSMFVGSDHCPDQRRSGHVLREPLWKFYDFSSNGVHVLAFSLTVLHPELAVDVNSRLAE